MAVMTDQQRAETWLTILRALIVDIDVDDQAVRDAIKAAVDYADGWADVKQTDYNAGLPEPFKSTSTPKQKAAVLAYVLHQRFSAGTE